MNQFQIPEGMPHGTIEISIVTIFKIVAVFVFLIFLFLVRDILLLIFVSFILAAVLNPFADRLEKYKIPRVVSVLAAYLTLFVFIGIIFSLLIPVLISEISSFAVDFPFYFEKFFRSSEMIKEFLTKYNIIAAFESILLEFKNSLSKIFPGIFVTTLGVLNNFVSFIVVLVVSGYLVIQNRQVGNFLKVVIPEKHKHLVLNIIDKVQEKIARWFLGQVVLCSIIGSLVFIGLSILGVPYALLLAIIAGTLELIPFVGPILSLIPAAFIAFLHSPLLGAFTIILYFIVQQFENYIIVPQVMKKAVGANPLVIIIGIMIGAELAGVLGIILAIPTIIIITILVEEVTKIKNENLNMNPSRE